MKHTFRIQLSILISFLAVLILACGSIIFYNFNKTTTVLLQKVDTELLNVTQNLTRATRDYLSSAKWLSQLIAMNMQGNPTLFSNDAYTTSLATNMLLLFPQISGFYCGDVNGNMLSIRHVPRQSLYPGRDDQFLPSEAAFEIRKIRRQGSNISENYQYLDRTGQSLFQVDNPNLSKHFDPRERPWFQGAIQSDRFYWSDPYIFQISNQIGITAAAPVYNPKQGTQIIASADITMTEVSKLLRENSLSKSSIIMILNEDGNLIGYPHLDKLTLKDSQGHAHLTRVEDTKNDLVIQAYNYYKKMQTPDFVFAGHGENYLARFIPFGQEFNKKWLILYLAPQSDFLSDTQRITQIMVLISFIIVLIAALVIYIISRNISRPIERVARELDSIKDLDIDVVTPRPSKFSEINQMNDALVSMKISLKNFGKFVPKDVVRKLIASGEGADLGGRRMNITVMFTDIQGFSGISEKMTSENLALHLSDYFDQLTKIIISESGTIDKYIGDSIMAFWGAPLESDNHTVQACRSTLFCINKLKELNKLWAEQGKPQFLTRFGIHTGEAVVGNVGSRDRLNYSAFGDTVNTASRLEGVNKVYGLYCLISETTYNIVKNQFICRPIDVVNVVGKTMGLKIYELMLAIKNNPDEIKVFRQLAQLTQEALDHYLRQDFTSALQAYGKILVDYPDDTIAPIFITRCQQFIENPPQNWTGIYRLTSK